MQIFVRALVLSVGLMVAPSFANARHDDERATVRVPQDAPTIQEAIHIIPDHGVVIIAPGAYMETVEIVGKQVDLVGGDDQGRRRTLIVGATPDEVVPLASARGLINYGPGGGGRLENLTLIGGDAAVLGLSDGRSPLPTEVTVHNVSILGNGRGVTGNFSQLILEDSSITQSFWHALSPCFQLLELEGMFIANSNQLGILVVACQEDQTIAVDNTYISGNLSGGAAFFGNVDVAITDSTLSGNSVFGVLLVHTPGQTVVSNTSVSGTVEGMSPGFDVLGDGLIALGTGLISMIGSDFVGNQSAGVILADVPTHGAFVNCVVSGNKFGLVQQSGSTFALVGSGNIFTGNIQTDFLTDGNLPVPEAPPLP